MPAKRPDYVAIPGKSGGRPLSHGTVSSILDWLFAMRPWWSSPRVWAGAAVAFALVATAAAATARTAIFDLVAEDRERSVRRLAAGAREVEVDPRVPWARIPRLLPGPADAWAGGRPHAVRFQLGRRPLRSLDLYLTREEGPVERPARLTVIVNGVTVTTVGITAGVGPRHRIRVPSTALGDAADVSLAVVADSGPGVVLERARLVEASPSFAWAHLARGGSFPPESAIFLAASLGSLLVWAWPRVPDAAGPVIGLLLLNLARVLPRESFLATGIPRWLWVAVPWGLLLARWGRIRLARVIGSLRPRAVVLNGLVSVTALALSLVAAEFGLRAWFRAVTSAGDTRTYFHQPGERVNSWGFREREVPLAKPDGVYRIAVIGDSLTWGPGVPVPERFSNLIERFLNEKGRPGSTYEALNFGISGWDTEDEVRILRQLVLKTDPDFVLLQWYVNDFENGYHLERPRPAPLVRPATLHLKLLRSSALYALLDPKWTALQEMLGLVESFPAYLYRRFGDPDGPDSTYEMERVKEFIGECRSHRIPVGIVLFPSVGPGLVSGTYEFGYLHDRVLAACRDENVTCVDLRSTFAGYTNYRTLWATPLDPHPSPLANRLAAERLVDAFGRTWLDARPERRR